MSLSKGNIQHVLNRFDAGVLPRQILNDLQCSGFFSRLKLSTLEQCLVENGRQMRNNQPSDAAQGDQSLSASRASTPPAPANQGASGPDPAAATEEARQVPANPVVQTCTTGALADRSPTISWTAQAEKFTMSAHRVGQTPAEICATLRRSGYNITGTEVVASLKRQGVLTGR